MDARDIDYFGAQLVLNLLEKKIGVQYGAERTSTSTEEVKKIQPIPLGSIQHLWPFVAEVMMA